MLSVAGRHFGSGTDEAGDGTGAAGIGPRGHDFTGAEVGDRHEGQAGSGTLLVGQAAASPVKAS